MPTVADEKEEQDSQVFVWRRRELIRLGFNRRQATRLAELSDVCHDAERLLKAGCPHLIVFDLLSP